MKNTILAISIIIACAVGAAPAYGLDASQLSPVLRAKFNQTVQTATPAQPPQPVAKVDKGDIQNEVCKAISDKILFYGYVRSWMTKLAGDASEFQNGRPIRHIPINLRDRNGSIIASSETDDNGYYCITNKDGTIPVGSYSLEVDDAKLPAHGFIIDPDTGAKIPLNEATGADVLSPKAAVDKRIDIVMNRKLIRRPVGAAVVEIVPPNPVALVVLILTALVVVYMTLRFIQRQIRLKAII